MYIQQDKSIKWEDKFSGNRLLNAKLFQENIEMEIIDNAFNNNEKQVVHTKKREFNESAKQIELKKGIITRNFKRNN